MQNWYIRSQTDGTPGADGGGPVPGAMPAGQPNPMVGVQEEVQEEPWTEVDYGALDQQIREKILEPLKRYQKSLSNRTYIDYKGKGNPFMIAMMDLFDNQMFYDFARHLESYENVSRQILGGTPNPSLNNWLTELVSSFPEGDAKIMLQRELKELQMPVVMQGQTG